MHFLKLLLDDKQTCEVFDFTTSEEAETSQGEMEDSQGEMDDNQHNLKSVCSPASKLNILRMIKPQQWA